MTAILRFLKFQREQDGVLTLDDAARYCRVKRSMVHWWAMKRRVAFIEHRGRRYFGRLSLSDWAALTRHIAELKDPMFRDEEID